MSSVWVIEPGHGSTWLLDAEWNSDHTQVTGCAWDDSGSGSALMPDDYRGEEITLTFPASLVLREIP